MVRDAEANAAADREFEELAQASQHRRRHDPCDAQGFEDAKDKVQADEKAAIEKAIADLEGVIKGSDKAEIEAKTKALTEASSSLAQRLYAEQSQQGGTGQASGAHDAGDDVVDAEFEEVKDK